MDKNMELANYIYETSKMGKQTLETLLKEISNKDNKIKKASEDILKGHEHFIKSSLKILKKNKATIKDVSLMAKMGSWMGIKTEVMKDNSDSRLADMIIRGLTMGVLELDKKIEAYKDGDHEVLKLAKELKKFEKESIELLKPYL